MRIIKPSYTVEVYKKSGHEVYKCTRRLKLFGVIPISEKTYLGKGILTGFYSYSFLVFYAVRPSQVDESHTFSDLEQLKRKVEQYIWKSALRLKAELRKKQMCKSHKPVQKIRLL